MSNERKVNPPKLVVKNLLALKKELWNRFGNSSGVGAEIMMKINSCLYATYPPVRNKKERMTKKQIVQLINDHAVAVGVDPLTKTELTNHDKQSLVALLNRIEERAQYGDAAAVIDILTSPRGY